MMLVIKKNSCDKDVLTLASCLKRVVRSVFSLLDRKLAKFLAAHDVYPVHSLNIFPIGISDEIRRHNPDIVHLHWVSGAVISIQEIASLEIPVVWTLHDLWPILGARHHPEKVDPYLAFSDDGEYVVSPNKWSRWLYQYKAKSWAETPITFVSQCQWSREMAERSKIGRGHAHAVIGCPLDDSFLISMDRKAIRKDLEYDDDDLVILIGGSGAVSRLNETKGFHYLFEALDILARMVDEYPVCILTIGNDQNAPEFPFKTKKMGHISDNRRLAKLYSAADLVVVPSVMETFGQSITEPMACGTPVIAFDVTSQKDLVEDGINGYLAEFPNVEDLALKIKLGLFKGNKLRKQCRVDAVSRWSQNIIAKQYAKVYQECRAYIRR